MRNHEEFVNEIYQRKETYLKEKKKTRKNIITFLVPFVLVAVLYTVMVLPAMMPAGAENPNYDSHGSSEENTTSETGDYSHLTDVYTEAVTSVKQPSSNGSPVTSAGCVTQAAERTTVAHSVSQHENATTGVPEAVKPTTVSPEIFIELDRSEYASDDKIALSITDTANVGFGYSKAVELWENNGGEWVFIRNNHPKPAVAYKALPSSMRDEITVSFEIDLAEYENLKSGEQYKILIDIENKEYEAFFSLTSQ